MTFAWKLFRLKDAWSNATLGRCDVWLTTAFGQLQHLVSNSSNFSRKLTCTENSFFVYTIFTMITPMRLSWSSLLISLLWASWDLQQSHWIFDHSLVVTQLWSVSRTRISFTTGERLPYPTHIIEFHISLNYHVLYVQAHPPDEPTSSSGQILKSTLTPTLPTICIVAIFIYHYLPLWGLIEKRLACKGDPLR